MHNLQQISGIPTSVCVLLFSFALRLLLFGGLAVWDLGDLSMWKVLAWGSQ